MNIGQPSPFAGPGNNDSGAITPASPRPACARRLMCKSRYAMAMAAFFPAR
ncbi:hypothetical protein IP95_01649 [Extensimonas vulgaris]|uniref:Uncharacterized protein n=1 Tax=Extensimonas vulgaris TaxID=1031594 RepID=A0A369AJ59_9BURK|nr:hypothetical protein DFR45_10529 [Extensimonas vulgaris]TWI38531.1 hypothetical protein IP95_01649 [Extensimonas vulgaris]